MKFLKNSYVAKKYGVSRPTVGKWIIATLEKDNTLELIEVGGINYIADTEHNHKELAGLTEKGKKFRNKIGYELIVPNNKIYEIFNESQLIEIITSLESSKIIPLKYTYFDKGAQFWDEYVRNDLVNQNQSNTREQELLLKSTLNYLDLKLSEYEQVNIVDVGPGNGYIARNVIDRVLGLGKPIKYVGIDISNTMLDILKANIKKWYPEIKSEYKKIDIDYNVIRDLLFFNKHENQNIKSCNLVLFFGSTIGNFYDRYRVYKNFYDSMSTDDFFWVNNGLETPDEMPAVLKHAKNQFISNESLWIPGYLGLNKTNCTVDARFNSSISSYTLILKLDKNIDIKFILKDREMVLSLKQNDEIIVWNYHSYRLENMVNELNKVGFSVVNQACYPDNSEVFILCEKIKKF